MARPVKLRVILADDDARKLILPEGLPSSTEDLAQKITEMFQLDGDIRLQYQDDDFGGEFVNLTTITDVQDKGTLKVIFKTTGQNQTAASTPACLMLCQADDSASVSSFETDDTVLLSSPDGSVQSTSRSAPWPLVFPIPRFSYDSEIILQQASVGCSEVSINSMKNKRQDQYHAASNIKKPRRAEVNYCPQHPKGETSESLERERVDLLAAIKKRNNDKVVKEKMERTFSYRRQEVVQEKPMIAEFKSRWPALFNVDEINTEFMRITTVPLEFKFLAMLDQYSDSLMKLFQSKGGVTGRTIKNIMQPISQNNSIDMRRECILKALCVYLNEDHAQLFKEYNDCDWVNAKEAIAQMVMGIYIVRSEGHQPGDKPVDVGIVIEGTEVLCSLKNVAVSVAMLFGLTYALNLSYPRELKATFEVIQKVFFGWTKTFTEGTSPQEQDAGVSYLTCVVSKD